MAKKTATKKTEGGMYALNRGHQTPFRRTVKYSETKSAQLVFEPGEAQELSDVEVAACQDLIDCGRLVEVGQDDKGRVRFPFVKQSQDADKVIASLEAKIEELSAVVAKQSAELAASTKSGNDDKTPNTDGQ